MAVFRARQIGILNAVRGARASMHWYGWLCIGLLVVPALSLAVFMTLDGEVRETEWVESVLPAAGLLALVASGVFAFRVLSSLRRLGELAQLLCEQGSDPVFVKDRRHRYRFVNEPAATLIGERPFGVIGRHDGELHPGDESSAFEENDRVCLERDLPTLFREVQTLPGGGTRSFLVSKRPLHDFRGRIAGLVGLARDITDELELRKLIRCRADEMHAWFDLNPLPVVIFASDDLRILKANAAAERCYGGSQHALQRVWLPDLFAPEEAGRVQSHLGNAARNLAPGSLSWRQRKLDGEPFEASIHIGNLPHEDIPAGIMMVRDVSGEHAARKELEACAARYEDLIESGLGMVWMHDPDGHLLRVNASLAEALGYEPEALVGRNLADFVAEDARDNWDDYMGRVRSLKRDAGVLHVSTCNGDHRVWQYHFVCYPDAEPTPYIMGSAQDVTLRHRQELRMRDRNQRDALTGCHTRRWLEMFAWQAGHDQVWGCVVVDIDYFRQVNASEGRARGDALLREFVGMLGNAASSGDAVVRLGGDEFVVVIPDANEAHMREFAERLGAAARDGMPVAFSLGWAMREAGESMESTLRRADKMLYRNRCDHS